MKKSIKAELVSLAHKILQLRDTVDYQDLAIKSRELHEKLTILAYAEKLEQTRNPTIGLQEVESRLNYSETNDSDEGTLSRKRTTQEEIIHKTVIETPSDLSLPKEVVQKSPSEILAENQARFEQSTVQENNYNNPVKTQEPIKEPIQEEPKDKWTETIPETPDIDKIIESIVPKEEVVNKKDSFQIDTEYGHTPVFEPKRETSNSTIEEKPLNLNEKLKSGKFKIGLNDKLSFIKHLFNGNNEDYNRVLSQLETFQTSTEAKQFITQMIKPDYNNWQDKEVQEERFMQIVEARYL